MKKMLIALVVLSGCSTVYEGRYAREDGWRPGTIVELREGDVSDRGSGHDCRKGMVSADKEPGRFATVAFFGTHRRTTISVPVQDGEAWQAGEPVYVDIDDCALAPRVKD